MLIHETFTKSVVCADQNINLQEACEIMRDEHVGSLVIVESMQNKLPVGFLTDRDIVIKIADHRQLTTPVRDVMSKEPVTMDKNEQTSKAIETMRFKGVRRIVITEASGQVCGILSTDDIIQSSAREIQDLGDLLESQKWQEGLKRHTRMG